MTWQMTSPRADISRRKLARAGAWRRVTASDGAWQSLEARGARDQPYRNFERRVGGVRSLTALRLSWFCRSVQDDLCGSFKTIIGAMFVAVIQTAVVCAV